MVKQASSRRILATIFFNAIIATIVTACAQTSSDNEQAQLSGVAANAVLNTSAFGGHEQRAPESSPTPTPDPTAEPTAAPTAIPTAPPATVPPASAPSCEDQKNQAFIALAQVINQLPASDRATSIPEGKNCQAALVKFSARAVGADGSVIKLLNNTQGKIGVSCTHGSKPVDMILKGFASAGLRNKNIQTVYVCAAGSDPATCSESSSSFVAAFEYGSRGAAAHRIESISDSGPSGSDLISSIRLPGGISFGQDIMGCSKFGLWSPLVIEKSSGKGIVTRDPLSTQTWFDLTGTGRKERISCVRDGFFVALPDANGKVNDIDQLFGNQTLGPDGERDSANGFVALAKYDDNGDGVIDRDDAVYWKLAIWEDVNCDGVAQRSELKAISLAGIDRIPLAYQEVIEADPFGNETRQRSVVTLRSGVQNKIYDMWFKSYGSK